MLPVLGADRLRLAEKLLDTLSTVIVSARLWREALSRGLAVAIPPPLNWRLRHRAYDRFAPSFVARIRDDLWAIIAEKALDNLAGRWYTVD